jgi:hypothetical protein
MEGHVHKKAVASMQKVDFYDELLSVALVENAMYVAVQPIVHNLLLDWEIQYQYLITDMLLSKYILSITMCGDDGKQQDMLCLHLEYLPGWLFRLQTIPQKDKLLRYQNECFQVLWRCFQRAWTAQLLLQYQLSLAAPLLVDTDELSATLLQIRNTALSVAQLANEQLTLPPSGSSPASLVVLSQHKLEWITAVPQNLANPISDVQIDEIRLVIQAICALLEQKGTTSKNAYRYIFEELYQSYGLTSYKLLSQDLFTEVMTFLTNWYQMLRD